MIYILVYHKNKMASEKMEYTPWLYGLLLWCFLSILQFDSLLIYDLCSKQLK